MTLLRWLSLALLGMLSAHPIWASKRAFAQLPAVSPAEAGMNAERLAEIDALVKQGISEKKLPGAVVLVGRKGRVVLLKAYGNKQIEPEPVPMTTDALFDLASLTKPIATATSLMLLVEDGKVKIDEPVVTYLPEFALHGKDKVTVRQLLIHTSGLIPDNALKEYDEGPEKAWEHICQLKLRTVPGERFAYSDVGYIVLGQLIQRVSGINVHEFSQGRIFQPLKMRETTFLPGEQLKQRTAPTQQRDGKWIQGEVHDPRAHQLGGVAGHAGLFSTADDLAIYASALLDQGRGHQGQLMTPEIWKLMTDPNEVPGRKGDGTNYEGLRGLGWDMQTGYSINRGESFSPAAFGHGGFTGTAIWIDPVKDVFLIFLSNRVHPNGQGNVNPLIGRIGTLVGQAVEKP